MQKSQTENRNPKPKANHEVIYLIIAIISGLVLSIGAGLWANAPHLARLAENCTAETVGTVENVSSYYDYDVDSHDSKHYRYSVVYYADGQRYSLTRNQGSEPHEGSTMTVHYDPSAPSEAYVGNKPDADTRRIVGIIMTSAGAVALAISIILIERKRHN